MKTIQNILDKYSSKLDFLDLELLIAHVLKKEREFVLAHTDQKITKRQETIIKRLISRRLDHEPMAYILGEKEFFGFKFKVDKNTLIPRPETEMLVEEVLKEIKDKSCIIDVGTGSGNIIVAIAKKIYDLRIKNYELIGIDISEKALEIANQNAKLNKVDKQIKFINGNLLNPVIQNSKLKIKNSTMIIVANLPYLSRKIYSSSSKDVKNFEPKNALFSKEEGLEHYKKLLQQIKSLVISQQLSALCFMEISPEQKIPLTKFIQKLFPKSKPEFKKDLAEKWRICKLKI
jgi:release factor glutamine methyltransferase